MRRIRIFFCLAILVLSAGIQSSAQLVINTNNSAIALAQKLVGEGVVISNATITFNSIATGFFYSQSGANIGIDSGIVLTNGRAKTVPGFAIGLDGDGRTPASGVRADANLGLPGDIDLANELGIPVSQLNDAIALEFDFIPLGDSIKFNYVMSSEEYTPSTVCVFNDAFGFFITGPGITGTKNIALIPGTNTPVTITNVNNVTGVSCINNPQYYINNTTNVFFTHEGLTTVFTASSQVQPCQRYHLKLVVADQGDHAWDTGVFLQAESLRSDPVKIQSNTPINDSNLPYFAEGCSSGSIHILRSQKKPYPQTFSLTYGGTATNGVDVNLLPSSVTIPANDSVVIIPISATADFIPEGNETLKIYIGNSCATVFSDSISIEIRDIDLLPITPVDSIHICRNNSVQLQAASGYLNYNWTNGATLSDNTVNNPVATPLSASTKYICTASSGNCIARDSVLVGWRTVSLASKTDILCKNGTNGSIKVTGTNWDNPTYALNNGPYQNSNTFFELGAGSYWVKVKDASGCVDSIPVTLAQAFPDISMTADPSPATCSISPDGRITIQASGGNGSYTYSADSAIWQNNNVLTVGDGTYKVYVKDGNSCIISQSPVVVTKVNTVTLDAGPDRDTLCEGTSYTIPATSNASSISWTPLSSLSNPASLTPIATPATTTKYFVTASFGTCNRTDSIELVVLAAPKPVVGNDIPICLGFTAQLQGSGGIVYQWENDPSFTTATDISDPVVKPTVTTTYYLQVKDANGCSSLQPGQQKVIVTTTVKVFAGNDTIITMNQPLQLKAIDVNNSGVTQWEWSPAISLDNPFTANPVALFNAPVTTPPYEYVYTVTGKTQAGCENSDQIKIKVYQGPDFYVPSGFTPNGDGKNDILIAVPVGIKELKSFRVFNRWGQIIFQSKTLLKGWDGKIAGSLQQSDVYVWIAEGIDYTGKLITRKGTVTLIR